MNGLSGEMEDRSSQFQMILPYPSTSAPLLNGQPCDSFVSSSAPESEKQVPSSVRLAKRRTARTPIKTRSGRRVERPQKLGTERIALSTEKKT